MKDSTLLQEGIQNWKLRLILSALLCVIGLSILISMVLGLFVQLSVSDKTIVSIAIFMVGTPAYLITSKLAKVDQYTIAGFLNTHIDEIEGNVEVLVKDEDELDEVEKKARARLEEFFSENALYNFLPDKPVKQAYVLFLISLIISFGIWFLS
jgi:ABC-type multidrug transport system fused ATPase/permease subunit